MAHDIAQYLLTVSYSPTADDIRQETPPAQAIPCQSLAQALHQLYLLPMDQFHKDVAVQHGFAHYLSDVLITDLHTGQQAAIIHREPRLPPNAEPAVWLEIGGAYPVGPLLQNPDMLPMYEPGGNWDIPFLEYYKKDKMLAPSPFYNEMFEQIYEQLMAPHDVFTTAKWAVSWYGKRLENPVVKGDTILYPPLLEFHFYGDIKPSLHKFISYPSEYFDPSQAMERGLDRVLTEGVLSNLHDDGDQTYARIYVVAPHDEQGHLPQQYTGRFLEFHPAIIEQLPSDMLQPKDVLILNDRPLIQLNRWNEEGTLVPTASLKALMRFFSLHPDAHLPHNSFEVMQQRFKPVEDTGEPNTALRKEMRFHTYANDLVTAMFELTQSMVSREEVGGEFEHILHESIHCQVKNGKGQLQFFLTNDKETQLPIPGIYMGINKDLEATPAFQQLSPQQLLQGGVGRIVQGDHVLYQVAGYHQDELVRNIGYFKFHLLQQSLFIHQQTQRRPELLQPQTPDLSSHAYVLSLTWQLSSGTTAATPITAQMGFSEATAALQAYFQLDSTLFNGTAFTALPCRLQLDSAAILQQQNEGLVQVMDGRYEQGARTGIRHFIARDRAGADFLQVLDRHFIREQDPASRRQIDPFKQGRGQSP